MRKVILALLTVAMVLACAVLAGCAQKSKQDGSTRLRTTDDYHEMGGPRHPRPPTPIPPKW
jgi:type IV pilus biogenesis protein CpaD/CtpE